MALGLHLGELLFGEASGKDDGSGDDKGDRHTDDSPDGVHLATLQVVGEDQEVGSTACEVVGDGWDFSTPYRTDCVGLMVKKRSGFTSIEDLDGKVIGVSQGANTQGLIEQMIKDNGFSCEPEFRAFSGYPIIKSSLDAGYIDVFAMDRSTLAGYMNETVELLQPEVKFGEQGYGVATKKGCDLSAVVDQVICDRLADGWLDQEVKTWGLV